LRNSALKLFIFKIPASGTDFQNTGLLPASAKLAVKYRPGRWNTGHLATLMAQQAKSTGMLCMPILSAR